MAMDCGDEHTLAKFAVVHQSSRSSAAVETLHRPVSRFTDGGHSVIVGSLAVIAFQPTYVIVERIEQVVLH